MKWQGILAVIGTIFLLVWCIDLLFGKDEEYFVPEVQVSELDGQKYVFDANSAKYETITTCPKCGMDLPDNCTHRCNEN